MSPLEMAVVCLAAITAMDLLMTSVECLSDRYTLLMLPHGPLRQRVRVVRPWYAVSSVVHHPGVGRCRVARLDRSADLGITWACIYPLYERDGWVPGAQWVPVSELGETAEEAQRLAEEDDPGEPPVGGGSHG